jgi:SAM-dependent methyltransferase
MMIKRIFNLIEAQLTKSPRTIVSQLTRVRTEKSIEAFLKKNKNNINQKHLFSIDLGSNSAVRNPFNAVNFIGVDIEYGTTNNNVIKCDLFNQKLPIEDSMVTSVTAYDFVEHVPRVVINNGKTEFKFVELMNEIYRVLKPGSLFFSVTPAYPYKEAFMDPTHVNIITEDTFKNYFCSDEHKKNYAMAKIYGFEGDFHLIDQAWVEYRLVTLMSKKVKD